MKLLLPTLGSAGDIHPFLAIGLAAKARGHEVEVMSNPHFAGMVRDAGLGFYPIGLAEQYTDTYRSRKLWHPIDGFGVFWRRMARHAMEPVYNRIVEHMAGPRCVVMATPLMLGARLAQEKLKVPLVTAYTAATMLRSCQHPLTMAHLRVPRWLPIAGRQAAWRAIDRWKLAPMVEGDLPPLRARLELPPLRHSVFGTWVHSPRAGITLFPAWFAPAPSDWPAQVVQAGFPMFDGDASQGLAPDLTAFLQAGPPPIVFTPGSAMVHGQRFFEAAVRSCIALGRRGLLLSGDRSQMPAELPPSVHAAAYAPFGLLLRHSTALVHHGGIGSCAQGLRAGIPQLLTPMGFDQFDNAMRLEHLGVGLSLRRSDTGYSTMTSLLRTLLGSAAVAAACRTAADSVARDEPLDVICDVLESVA